MKGLVRDEMLRFAQYDTLGIHRFRIVRNALIALILASVTIGAGIGATRSGDLPSAYPTGRMWLFLTPETISPMDRDVRLRELEARLTPRSLERRRKVLGDHPVRACDLLPSEARIRAVESTGCEVVRAVHYLNALVVTGSNQQIESATQLAFVESSRPVMAYPVSPDPDLVAPSPYRDEGEVYGSAYRQNRLANVPAAHNAGYRGRGILIGSQDTGFSNLNHRCYQYLHVLAAFDFVNNDTNVANEGDLGNGDHGSRTLSVIAGLDSGSFIGVAPDAQFVLTKTENSQTEEAVEEDYWVEGLWFHDSLGVDVLSSSLSYRSWYNYSDMDGRTAVTTRATDSAAAAGMVIVTSTGNTGTRQYPENKIGAPADGRYVLGIGGVSSDSGWWGQESIGPTYDGRIKPDLVALASTAYSASVTDDTSYAARAGTSFSTPLVAGIAALVLEANPRLTPAQVFEVLRSTASQHASPDTILGWGVPNALAAVRLAESMSVDQASTSLPALCDLITSPNPSNGWVTITFTKSSQAGNFRLVDLTGREIYRFDPPLAGNRVILNLSGYPAGTYYLRTSRSSTPLILLK